MKHLPIALLFTLAACGGPAANDFCGQVTKACGADAGAACRADVNHEKDAHPDCTALVDGFTECLAALSLTCNDQQITASHKGTDDVVEQSTNDYTDLGDQRVVVKDGACTIRKNGLDACRSCPSAAGATESDVHGVAEPCSADSDCATDLTCQSGTCTRSCVDASDCNARGQDCQLYSQYGNTCGMLDGKQLCTSTCAQGDDAKCRGDYAQAVACNQNLQCAPQ